MDWIINIFLGFLVAMPVLFIVSLAFAWDTPTGQHFRGRYRHHVFGGDPADVVRCECGEWKRESDGFHLKGRGLEEFLRSGSQR